MDSPTFVKRVAELSGVDKEIAERVVRATFLNLGTRIDPGEADDLAAQLPEAIGACLRHKWKAQRLSHLPAVSRQRSHNRLILRPERRATQRARAERPPVEHGVI